MALRVAAQGHLEAGKKLIISDHFSIRNCLHVFQEAGICVSATLVTLDPNAVLEAIASQPLIGID